MLTGVDPYIYTFKTLMSAIFPKTIQGMSYAATTTTTPNRFNRHLKLDEKINSVEFGIESFSTTSSVFG